MKFGKNRKAFTIAVVALGCLSFFLPVISIQAPIVGKMEFSPFNIVSRIASSSSQKSPSFTDVTAMTKEVSKSEASSPSSIQKSNPVPLGIAVIPFMPGEVAIAYLSLILIVFGLTVNPLQQNIRIAAVVGLAASVIALVSIYLFSDAIQSSMAANFNTPEMRDNPFAALGQALVQSVHVDPGSGIYLLVSAMAVMLIVCQFSRLDRLTLVEERQV
jgi:hypothetical protein